MSHKAEVLKKKVVSVKPATTVTEAAVMMKKLNIGSVLVGDSEKPAGIFTERDITRRVVSEGLDPKTTPVSKVMTPKLVTVESTAPLSDVFECLAKGHFRHLPITEKGKVVGIISLSDLAKVLGEMSKEDSFLRSFNPG